MFRKKAAWVAVLATGTIAAILPSAAASASVTFTSTSYYVTNLVNTSVTPGDPNYTPIITADIPMQQGENLRVTDQLSVTLTASDSPMMDNRLTCTEPGGQVFQTSDGTNWANVGGPESWSVTLLMTAQMSGTAHCEIFSQSSDGHGNGYQMSVVPYDPSDLTGTSR